MYSLTHLLSRAARINRDGVATICDDRRQSWSQLEQRVARLAAALRSLGVRADERVAVLSPNSDRVFEYLFAVNWAGGVVVPINTRLAPTEVLDWLHDADCALLAYTVAFEAMIGELRRHLPGVRHFIRIDGDTPLPAGTLDNEGLIASQTPAEDAGRSGTDLAALFYTGGTTGRSRGVMITHQGMAANIMQWIAAVGVNAADRFLIVPPMFHAAGGENCLAATALTATACILPRFEVGATLELIQRERISKLPVVATMLDMMVNHPDVGSFDLSSVRKITYGASPIPPHVLERALQVFPDAQFYQVYGQTEGGPTITVLDDAWHRGPPERRRLRSAGVPVIGSRLRILDLDDKELPAGETGEVCVQGPGVSPGYWKLPDVTAHAQRGGWLHTGDAGYVDDDGFLHIVDRVKDMIISGGENVYPVEVELVLVQHPAVRECAVIGIPSERWGEQVHAIVRLQEGATASADELIAHCREKLAGYKCPRSLELRAEAFPISAANKVLKRELRREYLERMNG